MRNQELARYITGPDSAHGQFHDPATNAVRQGAAIHEHPAQLVDPSLTCKTDGGMGKL